MSPTIRKIKAIACLLSAVFCLQQSADAVISIYVSPPGSSTTNLSGAIVENFDNAPSTWDLSTVYESPIGDYTNTTTLPSENGITTRPGPSDFNIDNSQSISLDFQAELTLTLDAPTSYFGFAWPAGDNNNIINVFDGSQLLFSLNTSDIVDFLPRNSVTVEVPQLDKKGNPKFNKDGTPKTTTETQIQGETIQAINGTNHNSLDYYGQPGTGTNVEDRTNSIEPYAYIHIFSDGADDFDRITFQHLRTDGGGEFETDNHALLAGPVDLPDATSPLVLIFDDAENQLPESNTYVLIAGLLSLGVVVTKRSRNRDR